MDTKEDLTTELALMIRQHFAVPWHAYPVAKAYVEKNWHRFKDKRTEVWYECWQIDLEHDDDFDFCCARERTGHRWNVV